MILKILEYSSDTASAATRQQQYFILNPAYDISDSFKWNIMNLIEI